MQLATKSIDTHYKSWVTKEFLYFKIEHCWSIFKVSCNMTSYTGTM